MKTLLSYLLLITVTTTCFSQNEAFFGIKSGATLSNFRGNDEADQNNLGLDYLFGVSGEFPISKKFSLLLNINYHRKSAVRKFKSYELSYTNIDPTFSNEDIRVKSTILYLSLPLSVKYKFGTDKSYFLNGGAFIDFLNNTEAKVDGEKIEDNSRQFFQQIDFGSVLSIGKSFKSPNGNQFTIELRNQLGLINISRIEDSKVLTNSWIFSFEYQFNLKAKEVSTN
jgi:hypothetical protein